MRAYVLVAVLALVLAGCSAKSGDSDDDLPDLDVDKDTGGIRGFAVDDSFRPIEGADVRLNTGESTTTDAEGLFVFEGLEGGVYAITGSKPGYQTSQIPWSVTAGDANPPSVKLVMPRLVGKDPFHLSYKLDGFYECAFAGPFITDGCDFAYRTVWDEVNHTYGPPPGGLPRTVQRFHNTDFLFIAANVETIIQEGFWTDSSVAAMMISLDETPIDNACDCSDSYINTVSANPTYGRLDREGNDGMPTDVDTAVRGFLPFTDVSTSDPASAVAAAQNFSFTIITTLFYNYPAPEGWTIVDAQ